jgi:ribA/ribD-fused uncharacterized protein
MPTAGQRTQAQAYAEIKASGLLIGRAFEVYDLLCAHESLTGAEVDDILSVTEKRTVRSGSPRLNELVKAGVAVELDPRPCKKSGMTVLAYAVVRGALPTKSKPVVIAHDLTTVQGRAAALIDQIHGKKRGKKLAAVEAALTHEAELARLRVALPGSAITKFRGAADFLSNFHPSPIEYDGRDYATVEHFFQAFKARTMQWHDAIRLTPTPTKAKKMGRACPMREGWEESKIKVMRLALQLKFAPGSELAAMLLTTDTVDLVEGNTWGDQFWGCVWDHGWVGENHLGKLLMEVRQELRD